MSLAKKLQIKSCETVLLVNAPEGFSIGALTTKSKSASGVLVFARNKKELDKRAGSALEAAHKDHLSWIAYLKAGQLGTDLNRDVFWKLLKPTGVKPVRQVALDDVWSALRFRLL